MGGRHLADLAPIIHSGKIFRRILCGGVQPSALLQDRFAGCRPSTKRIDLASLASAAAIRTNAFGINISIRARAMIKSQPCVYIVLGLKKL